jgi:hypothetical protein
VYDKDACSEASSDLYISFQCFQSGSNHNTSHKQLLIVAMPEVYAAHPEYAFDRNFKGYGEKGLEGLKWPNNAKVAVSFVINYEEVSCMT